MKKNKLYIIGRLILIIILAIAIYSSKTIEQNLTFFDKITFGATKAISNYNYRNRQKAKAEFSGKSLEQIESENLELKKQLEEAKLKLTEFEVMKNSNIELANLLELKNKYLNFKTLPAQVIAQNFSNLEKTVVINLGKKDGITESLVVVSQNGLYGKIVSVSEKTAKVQLITDEAFKVSVNVQNSDKAVIAKGDLENNLILTRLPLNYNLVKGQEIYTAGIGGIFPKGIFVGKVGEIKYKSNEANSYAVIDNGGVEGINNVLVLKRGTE